MPFARNTAWLLLTTMVVGLRAFPAWAISPLPAEVVQVCGKMLGEMPEQPVDLQSRQNQDTVAILFGELYGVEPQMAVQQLRLGPGHSVVGLPPVIGCAACSFQNAIQPLVTASGDGHATPPITMALPDATKAVQQSPRAVRLYGSLVRASTMDGWFSPFEGERHGNYASLDPKQSLESQLRQRADAQKIGARTTPMLTHTDDTQFWMAGVLTGPARLRPGTTAVDALIETWREFGQNDVWRNGGARTAGFLQGRPDAFAGDVGAGDFLRGLSVFLLNPKAWRENWTEAAKKLQLRPTQTDAVHLFLEAYEKFLDGDSQAAEGTLQKLEAQRGLPPRMATLILALRTHVVQNQNFITYVQSFDAIGSDVDTYAFLGGLFATDRALPMSSIPAYPARVETFAAAAMFRTAGVPVDVHEDMRWEFIGAERDRNTALAKLRRGQR